MPALVRRVGARPVTVVSAVALAVARLALTATPGGRPQLWLATAGLLAGLVWLVGVAAGTDRPVPGLALGLAVNAVGHALLDTYDLVWRGGWVAWLLSSVAVALFLLDAALPAAPPGRAGARSWLLFGPTLLLSGMVALAPALAQAGMSYLEAGGSVARSPLFGLAPVPVAVGGFLLAALTGPNRRWARPLGPAALLAGAVLFALDSGDLLVVAMLLSAVGLGACLAVTDDVAGPETAATDGPDRNPAQEADDGRRAVARRGYAVAGGMLVFVLGSVGYYSAYDLGYPNAAVPVVVAGVVAAVALAARPTHLRLPGPLAPLPATAVVTVLALLVWGDAVLSRWPVTEPKSLPLPAVGAPTGAQALAVTLDLGDGVRAAVVSTHLQPPPGRGPVVQARAVADFATGYAAGRPLVVAGDLNTEPGDEAFGQFTAAGLVDALAGSRPLATSPADDPREQIDHVFVSPGLTATDPVAPRGEASDHLPVAVTVALPPR
ncbi:endonuclease/exonuclease/phosphatase family protein [Micromonospora sp. NPDC049102]|uniref:endonuclease/exonuclease/phosphatase family protein n=1 Tax=Micromonospora sp. NPDC049102 TaxID=3364265 RepID=UPI003720F46F